MREISIFRTTPRIVIGAGAICQLGQEAKALKIEKALFVTDKGVISAGILDSAKESLDKAKIPFAVFDRVEPDPRFEIVADCIDLIQREKPSLIIGFGGGSPIDIAKTAAVMTTNEGPIIKYFGIDLIPKPGLPTIIVPTTAGTGSEVTPVAILSDEGEKLKKAIFSPYLFPSVAILDPELTFDLPQSITAATGMDALIHAIEAFTSVKATNITDMLAIQAMDLVYHHIRTVYANGKNLDARSKMMEGSLLAGMAFANAGVTAVHAFAYPIGAEFHIPHGVANSIMLPPVMEFNMVGNLEKFSKMAEIFDEPVIGLNQRERASRMVKAIRELVNDLHIPKHLRDFGVEEHHIPALAEGVMKVTRLLANNPRRITKEDAEAIYKQVI